jgi:hypothetical protein
MGKNSKSLDNEIAELKELLDSNRIPLGERPGCSLNEAIPYAVNRCGGPLSAAQIDEASKLAAEWTDAIGCAAGYGLGRPASPTRLQTASSSRGGDTNTAQTGDLAVSALFFQRSSSRAPIPQTDLDSPCGRASSASGRPHTKLASVARAVTRLAMQRSPNLSLEHQETSHG